MPQTVTPVADVSVNGFLPTPVYIRINATAPNDASYVYSQLPPQGDSFEVAFPPLAVPGPGNLTFTVRLNQDAPPMPGDPHVKAILTSAGIDVALRIIQPTATATSYTFTLEPYEVDSITDYARLHLRVIAGIGTTPACPAFPVSPEYWMLTFTNVQNGTCGECASVINRPIYLKHDAGCVWMAPQLSVCGKPTVPNLVLTILQESLNIGSLARYVLAAASWQNMGPNVMTLDVNTSDCTNWPSQVTLTAI